MKTARILSNLKITKILSPRVTCCSAERNDGGLCMPTYRETGASGLCCLGLSSAALPLPETSRHNCKPTVFFIPLFLVLRSSSDYRWKWTDAHERFSTYKISQISWLFSYRRWNQESFSVVDASICDVLLGTWRPLLKHVRSENCLHNFGQEL